MKLSKNLEKTNLALRPCLNEGLNLHPELGKGNAQTRGFSLIEMIGVATVLALLALALTPILIKQFDRIAGEKEEAQLKAFGEAFRQGILKSKVITNANGWAAVIAANLNVNTNQVLINERRVPRMFLIDPRFRIGQGSPDDPITNANNFLPYAQLNLRSAPPPAAPGSKLVDGFQNVVPPFSPRVMILSSISQPIPVFASGDPQLASQYFADLWNSSPGAPPTWLTDTYLWGGKPEDLKIERIHLSDLFVEVIMNNQNSVDPGPPYRGATPYLVDNVTSALVGRTNSVSLFLLDSTVLTLYGTNGVAQYTEILHESKSFIYDGGNWKGGGYVGPTIHHPDPVDLQMVADAFLPPPVNPQATYSTTDVINAMKRYMTLYVTWAGENFQNTPALDCLIGSGCQDGPGAQPDLHTKAYDLITKPQP